MSKTRRQTWRALLNGRVSVTNWNLYVIVWVTNDAYKVCGCVTIYFAKVSAQ